MHRHYKLRVAVALLAACAPATGQAEPGTRSRSELLRSAHELELSALAGMDARRLQAAAEAYIAIADRYSDVWSQTPWYLLHAAQLLTKAGAPECALDVAQRSLLAGMPDASPEYVRVVLTAAYQRAVAGAAASDRTAAEEALQLFDGLRPKTAIDDILPLAPLYRGILLRACERHAEAAEALQGWLVKYADDPSATVACHVCALSLRGLGRNGEARDMLLQLRKRLAPDDSSAEVRGALQLLADILANEKNFELAAQVVDEVLARSTTPGRERDAAVQRAVTIDLDRGRIEGVEHRIAQVVDPTLRARMTIRLADAELSTGECVVAWRQLASIEKCDDAVVAKELGDTQARLLERVTTDVARAIDDNKPAYAATHLATLEALVPQPDRYQLLGRLLRARLSQLRGEHADAEHALREVLASPKIGALSGSHVAVAHASLAACCRAQSRAGDAIAHYLLAADVAGCPNLLAAQCLLAAAGLSCEQGEWPDAERIGSDLSRRFPDSKQTGEFRSWNLKPPYSP